MPVLPQDELQRFLEGVDPDIATEIQARYADAVAYQGAGSWTREQTLDWLTEQVATMGGEGDQEVTTSAAATRMSVGAMARRAGEEAQRAATEADERAARVRSRSRVENEYIVDAGPAMDPGQISTSLAVGSWVNDHGDYIDPRTGEVVDQPFPATADTVFEMIRGQRFNMGTLSMPGYAERRTTNYRPVRRGFTGTEPGTPSKNEGGAKLLAALGVPTPGFDPNRPTQTRVLTPSQAMALLNSMDEDYLASLQQKMWDAGLYSAVGEGARPDWGRPDPITQAAFRQLFIEASLDPSTPLNDVLARLADRNITSLADVPGAPGSSTGQAPDFTPEVASEATLGRLIDELAANLLGENVDDATKSRLIANLQAQETEAQRQAYEQDLNRFQAGGDSGVPGMEDIDVFMNAISGLESGGSYTAQNDRTGAYGRFQIMPENWKPWATRAGLGPNAPRTPENQEIVAKRIMMDYFAQFGNWRDVAIAWFAGPDDVGSASSLNKSDGNMTVAEYANNILDRMAALKGQPGAAGTPVGGQAYPAIERFDPAAEAEAALKAQNPNAWMGHQWGNRAIDFFDLLSGVA